jgi:hypothetical protein
MRFLLLTALAAALMIGCAEATTPADQAMASLTREIAALFKDPASVRLTDVVVYDADLGRRIVCGNVNVHNNDGSYTGFRPFGFCPLVGTFDVRQRRLNDHVDLRAGVTGDNQDGCRRAGGPTPLLEQAVSGAQALARTRIMSRWCRRRLVSPHPPAGVRR